MEDPAASPTTSTVTPAGQAALSAEDEVGEHRPDASTGLAGLSVAALGVVFGDIGTSPVYTFRECFNPEPGLPLDAEHVLGVLSMIFWALIIVVTVKYVLLIMRADNQGEGGILALLALALEATQSERSRTLLILLALGGARGVDPRACRGHLRRRSGRRLRRARGGRARHHRRRGALRRYGPFWPLPDQTGVVRPSASRSRPQLFRTRRSDPQRQISNREPVLPHGAGLGLVPAC